jgi:peptide deformylase
MSDLICELVKETDPFLREKPETFNFENPQVDPEKLSAQLVENMIHHEGLGLSANQIGIPVQAFSMLMDENALVVFNPEILEWDEETTYMKEGCLSFPSLWIAIERAKSVAVKFQVFDGEDQAGSMTDLSARIFQHESEHMDGDLFINSVSRLKLKSAMRKRNMNLRKLKRKNK